MKFWKRKVMSLTRDEIDEAVKDDYWQEFRLSLKGLPTTEKLDRLEEYLRGVNPAASLEEIHMEQVRVDNYINALLRGGQLRKICNELLVVAR